MFSPRVQQYNIDITMFNEIINCMYTAMTDVGGGREGALRGRRIIVENSFRQK